MRCRNCGTLGHRTQVCPRYGPWYPAPGKTRDDYTKLAERITKLVAADIMAEHEGRELEEEYAPRKKVKSGEKSRHQHGHTGSAPESTS